MRAARAIAPRPHVLLAALTALGQARPTGDDRFAAWLRESCAY